jgi:hypothetical protein
MTDQPTDAKTLKEKIMRDLDERSGYWHERKENTSYSNNEEYWWECKAYWSMFAEAAGLVKAIDCSGTVETFKVTVREAV